MFELIDAVIVRPIANILFVIYGFVGDFGLAIILFTVLVKILLWPLVKRQLHQTRLMRKIQPELAEIKKNCNGNRQLESLQMMDLYKRNNIKPFRSMLTLIIQLPIFIALYTAVRAVAVPQVDNNLNIRAYPLVRQIDRVEEVTQKQTEYLDSVEAANEANKDLAEGEARVEPIAYDFHPKLFGFVDLDVKPGFTSASAVVMLLFAFASAGTQYWISRQQLPSKKAKGAKTFRQIMREAADGQEPDQSELNTMMSSQMSKTMPIFMLLIMINLPGALVFYYMISNLMTGVQQKYILSKSEDEMEVAADKKIIRELNKITEGQVVEPKRNHRGGADGSGSRVTKITAKSKKRRKAKKPTSKS